MARESMVTRTIKTTKASVLCVDTIAGECFNKDVELSGTYADEKELLKHAAKMIDCDNVKAVQVVAHEVREALYGMSENKFIEFAEILPPRTIKNEDNKEA